MKVTQFEHQGRKFVAEAELRDTDYGPENRVQFRNEKGGSEGVWQECASTETIIRWFKDDLEVRQDELLQDAMEYEDEQRQSDYLDVTHGPCCGCGKPCGPEDREYEDMWVCPKCDKNS